MSCWGDDSEGQVSGAPAGTFDQLAVGQFHSCALDAEGYATCWGVDAWGTVSETPADVQFSAIDPGWLHTCGVRLDDSTVACWGEDGEDRTSPPAGAWVQSSSEGYASCAVAPDGALGCWGRTSDGVTDPPAGDWTETHTGTRHACARAADGTIDCWGSSDFGQGHAPDTPGICTNFAPDDDGNGIPDACE